MTEAEHLGRGTSATQSLYQRYRKAITALGTDVSVRPTEVKYIGFWVNDVRFIGIRIRQHHIRIWFNVNAGTLVDPLKITTELETGLRVEVRSDNQFDSIVALIEQAYRKHR